MSDDEGEVAGERAAGKGLALGGVETVEYGLVVGVAGVEVLRDADEEPVEDGAAVLDAFEGREVAPEERENAVRANGLRGVVSDDVSKGGADESVLETAVGPAAD